ncbi:uncharacterized protein Tco025E_09163 [Trypanosoma conorhini]|uniref:Uncharacterized protein n=1 Tax=Trypanosoma conorhini TaxID=83891 RepID=A0A422N043_9TRYP|nr:uncharacterized protein Tco025E_09163 [Trypanosoma conorhini]RNE98807.1 hypothetical protein Tco025E_09163 [Trypanosoma conorhini]
MTAAESYSFAMVRGDVFGRGPANAARRPYVPKGSRVHLSVTAATTSVPLGASQQLGVPRRLRKGRCGDGEGGEDDGARGDTAAPDNEGPVPVALMGLISTDSSAGTRLVRRTAVGGNDGGGSFWDSDAVPSGQRIGCIQLAPESRAEMLQFSPHAAVFPSPRLYVADTIGNVYYATLPATSLAEISDEPPKKRPRRGTDTDDAFWRTVASATTSEGGVTYGAPGWCGLLPFSSGQLVCCREFFFDLRLVDVPAGTVVRQYGTIHPATGVTACSGVPHGAVVAEGPVATLYDMRCPGAALTLSPDSTREVPLVTSRLTSPASYVADVCATCNDYEVAVAVGRSLCVHDVRKWSRVSVSTNTLKYEIASIAAFASGKAVVVAGIDAEVRIVPLQKTPPAAAAPARAAGNGLPRKEEDAAAASPASFRNRLDSAVCCRSTWNGGWVAGLDGVSATGVSADHEVFVAF